MALNSEQLNKIFLIASTGGDIEKSGLELTDEVRQTFEEVWAEIYDNAPEETMSYPIFDWTGDQYDDLLESSYKAWGRPKTLEEMQKGRTSLVSKSVDEKKFTLGPMYIPHTIDAHDEWVEAEELQKAVWDYVRSGDRRIRLQHNRDIVAGEWVEIMTFPYEMTVPLDQNGMSVEMKFPKDTVFLGVIWEDWAWELVKSGKLRGYSIGGKAERLYAEIEKSEPSVNSVHVDTIMSDPKDPKKKKKEDK